MYKMKTQKGITLVALIITIVVLLILAVVAINSIQNDGIISKAEEATNKYNESVQNEADQLQNYIGILNQYVGGSGNGDDPVEYEKVADARTSKKVYTSNTFLQDDNGNLVKVPAGFKIASDSATVVTGGVVIEDATYEGTMGSQFVWIPTGTIYTNAEKATDTITLARYTFNVTLNEDMDAISDTSTGAEYARYLSATDALEDPMWTAAGMDADFVEGEIADIDDQGKGYALSISNFLNSAKPISEGGNGGYYIGRYEARTNSTTARTSSDKSTLPTVTTIAGNSVYNYITQPNASTVSKNMYATNTNFTSDLVNSFAWDTAIAFIQEFGGEGFENYSMYTSKNTGSLAEKGTNNLTSEAERDVVCNIWDMASNCFEWSTETCSGASYPCVSRGGSYVNSIYYTSLRGVYNTSNAVASGSFRPLLYVGL